MGERILAKDETKRTILWWINREAGVQVRQGKIRGTVLRRVRKAEPACGVRKGTRR